MVKIPKNKINILRLLLPAFFGYLVSYFCKMDNSPGFVVKFRPPSFVFAIVWPILYILLGISWIYSVKKYSIVNDLLFLILINLLTIWIYIYPV